MAWKFGQKLPLIATVVPHLSKQNRTDCFIRVFKLLSRKGGTFIITHTVACECSTHADLYKKSCYHIQKHPCSKKGEPKKPNSIERCYINVRPRMLLDCIDQLQRTNLFKAVHLLQAKCSNFLIPNRAA